MREFAILLPAAERKELLEHNFIHEARPLGGSYQMQQIMILHREYYEPTLNITCGLCYDRVLKFWRLMQDTLVEMEREDRLL